jgi:hypothetical protein
MTIHDKSKEHKYENKPCHSFVYLAAYVTTFSCEAGNVPRHYTLMRACKQTDGTPLKMEV